MVSRENATIGSVRTFVSGGYRRVFAKTKLGAGPIAGSVNLPLPLCDQ